MTTSEVRPGRLNPDDVTGLLDEGHRFEVMGGRPRERHMGIIPSWIGGALYSRQLEYATANRWGWVYKADAGFTGFPRGNLRYPDVAAVRFGRFPNEEQPSGHAPLAPDFVAEVVSPNDKPEDLEEKLLDYRAGGVRLVWVIYPATRTARAYRPDRTTTEYGFDDLMTGETVLPGFTVRLGDLFPPPRPNPPAPVE
jgi:Uma2 family endonuclease